MAYFFGLYFGNSNLSLAVHRDGKTEVLANAAGDRVTPALVAFVNGERSLGLAAKQGMLRNANNTLSHVKSMLCDDQSIINELGTKIKCKIVNDGGLIYEIEHEDKVQRYTPRQVLIFLFKNMAEIAKSYCHENDIPIVLTTPFTYELKQNELIKEIVTDAGLRLLRVISEPSAAVLAYDVGQESSDCDLYCLVFRMGGTSLDLTLIHVLSGIYHVVTHLRRNMGGDIFTSLISEFCITEFYRKYKIDLKESRRSIVKLQIAAETAKHVLSTMGSAQCFMESVYEGIDLNINISRARFESLIASTLLQLVDPIKEVLKNGSLSESDISKVILCGGTCKIPKLQQFLTSTFATASVLTSIPPDEVIAMGAAKEAALVSADDLTEDECYVNTLSEAISLKMSCEVPSHLSTVPVFAKGTLIPSTKYLQLPIKGELVDISFTLFEGEISENNESSGDCVVLGEATMTCTPNKDIEVRIAADGALSLTCFNNTSGTSKTLSVVPSDEL